MTFKEWLKAFVTLRWVVVLLNWKIQGLPKFQYLSSKEEENLAQVMYGGCVVSLFNTYYSTDHGCYIYWATPRGGCKKTQAVPIIETYLEQYAPEAEST
jgi:hypothetical protein